MTVSSKHPVGRLMLEAAREQGWDVGNPGEAEVAHQLGLLGYMPRDVETQFKLGPYRLDFAIPSARIDIEADGWVHGTQQVRRRDERRDQRVKGWGWIVVRIDTERDDVADQLRRHLPVRVRVMSSSPYPRERVLPGILARLATEDWSEMTSAANASANHVKSLDRWVTKAREANPALNDEQAERLAVMMRKAHYVRMGKLSAEARRAGSRIVPNRGMMERDSRRVL